MRPQRNFVTELRQLTRPIMCSRTGLHADQAGRQRRKKLLAAQLQALQTMIGSIERRLTVQHRANEASKRLQSIHGIGISHRRWPAGVERQMGNDPEMVIRLRWPCVLCATVPTETASPRAGGYLKQSRTSRFGGAYGATHYRAGQTYRQCEGM